MTPFKANIDLRKHIVQLICVTVFLVNFPISSFAQLSVSTTQNLSFGTFASTGGGGTVIVSSTGVGSATGNVVLMSNSIESAAIFRLTAIKGNNYITSITSSNTATLTRSGGGGTMTMTLGTPSPNTSFSINGNQSKNVSIGGTLTIGTNTANPGGSYTGSFSLYINYN